MGDREAGCETCRCRMILIDGVNGVLVLGFHPSRRMPDTEEGDTIQGRPSWGGRYLWHIWEADGLRRPWWRVGLIIGVVTLKQKEVLPCSRSGSRAYVSFCCSVLTLNVVFSVCGRDRLMLVLVLFFVGLAVFGESRVT